MSEHLPTTEQSNRAEPDHAGSAASPRHMSPIAVERLLSRLPPDVAEELRNLPPDARVRLLAYEEYEERRQLHVGPLPPPETIARYEDVLPGAAERIFARFEKQSDHRMNLEKTVVEGDARRANWGLACATVVALAFLGVGYELIRTGHEWAGAVVATVDVAGIVYAYIDATRNRKDERLRKQRMVTDQEKPPSPPNPPAVSR